MRRACVDSRKSAFGLLIAAGLAAGCSLPKERFYPIGIYGPGSTNNLAVLRDARFNAVLGSANADFLDAAAENGLKVMAVPGSNLNRPFDARKTAATVRRFDSHPAMWAWYLVDEPDLHAVPPERVREVHQFVKKLPTTNPTALVLFHGNSAGAYAGLTDITMIDRYPVPWLPLADFSEHVRKTRLALGPERPMIAVIQAFDWSYHKDMLPGVTQELRPPNKKELRCMTYMALAHGATGLFYYSFRSGDWKIREHPEVWQALKEVVHEVNERLPLFKAEHQWLSGDAYHETFEDRFNELYGSAVNLKLLKVRKGNHRVLAGRYLLGVNTTPKDQTFVFKLPEPHQGFLPVFEGDRLLFASEGWIRDSFAPYEIHVYGPF